MEAEVALAKIEGGVDARRARVPERVVVESKDGEGMICA